MQPDEALDAIEARQREAMEGSFRVIIAGSRKALELSSTTSLR